ncbi:TPA_asm: maturation protein [ssRNA phage Zoerhiza.1_34]|uniref:Maturation protein n=2 Tax=Leviviricetes TaxID=2842243 RepID=A0A8S5KXW5_9VIRU|nr:maturation protein [ssRNA phage Zoerhiza.1_34]DAD49943.1 TPA_asm: maturation protein [ssRNA phage Zoerhiza.1_34]
MGATITQKRDLNLSPATSWGGFLSHYRVQPGWAPDVSVNMQRTYSQTTTSFRSGSSAGTEINPREILNQNNARNLRPFDRGHEFSTRKGKILLSHPNWKIRGLGDTFYEGPLTFSVPGDNMPGSVRDYDAGPVDLSYGVTAISKVAPTKQVANLEQLFVELYRDLPKYPGLRLTNTKKRELLHNKVADEYLNIVFGWQPTIQDVLKICETIVRWDELSRQYIRDAGQQVRRQFEFEAKREYRNIAVNPNQEIQIYAINPYQPWSNNFYSNPFSDGVGTVSLDETKYEKYWFSGAFMYYLNTENSLWGKLSLGASIARKLLGLEGVTLRLIYEQLPYSWLADWFINANDLISNIDSFSRDGLVLRYGYLMRETILTRTYTHSGITHRGGRTGPFSMTEVFSDKRRIKATPYGFGVTPDSFSPVQWAILAALGFTKSDRNLF